MLLYALDATDEVGAIGMFRARSGRDSSLTVAATLPIALAGGVKTWKTARSLTPIGWNGQCARCECRNHRGV